MVKYLLVLLFLAGQVCAQTGKYVVVLKDKAGTTSSVSNPSGFLSARALQRRTTQGVGVTEQDMPVSATYLDALRKYGKVSYASRWLNAVLLEASATDLPKILSLPFVKGLESGGEIRGLNLRTTASTAKFGESADINYGQSKTQLEMMGVPKMHAAGFTGKGVLMGLLDSGFLTANTHTAFTKLLAENRVLDTWDFVNHERNVYNDDSHGLAVLGTIAASAQGSLVGGSPDVQVALYTTEDVGSETRLEEFNWLVAAERADSLGVDIIQSSLGYNLFDNPAQNYTIEQMDGKTTLAARAANWAAARGILVVISAGNEGNKAWRRITTPADATGAIAVAAVDASGMVAAFSSVGPSADGRIKPDIASMGVNTAIARPLSGVGLSNGTSFASPLISAFLANIKQQFPTQKNEWIIDHLKRSGSAAASPTNSVGYGVPEYTRFLLLDILGTTPEEPLIQVFPNPTANILEVQMPINQRGIATKFSLINSLGQVIYSDLVQPTIPQISIPIDKLESGIYLLHYENKQQSGLQRVVISK